MNEPVGKLLTQKEEVPMPFKYVTSVGTLTLVLSRPRRFSWKSGVEMEGHEKNAGSCVEGSESLCMQKRKMFVLPLLVTACVNSIAPLGKGPVRVAFPLFDLVLNPGFFHLCLPTIRLLAVSVYNLGNHGSISVA